LGELSNDELERSLHGLLGAGARVEARIVAHLAEVEARRLHLLAGCSSLYDYCRKRLGLSEYEAFLRIAASRVARKYSVVFGMLERRELHLTAICEVRELLTAENHRDLLDAVSGKTKLQIREILAQRFPQADVPTSLKRLPALEPLSPDRYRLVVTLNAEQKAKLELARDLLSHANSVGDLAIVVERALDELIARLEKRRFGRRRRKHISHEVRRELLDRDGLSCAFVSDEGERCGARAFLQFHHRHAWAHGGTDTSENLELLCHAHNRLLAERDFGATYIDAVIHKRKGPGPSAGT